VCVAGTCAERLADNCSDAMTVIGEMRCSYSAALFAPFLFSNGYYARRDILGTAHLLCRCLVSA